MQMPFGKYKGRDLAGLPQDYLDWLASLDDLRPVLRAAVQAEIWTRAKVMPPPPLPSVDPTLAGELIRAGRKILAVRYHPDHGGSADQMARINDAADRLLVLFGPNGSALPW